MDLFPRLIFLITNSTKVRCIYMFSWIFMKSTQNKKIRLSFLYIDVQNKHVEDLKWSKISSQMEQK